MDIYAENILDHYRHPRHKDLLKDASIQHEEINHSCGDALTVSLVIESDAIKKIGWDGTGCAISQAAISIISEELEGKTLDQIEALTKSEIIELLGVPIGPRRVKCALLCLHTLKNAIHVYKKEQTQSWLETVEAD